MVEKKMRRVLKKMALRKAIYIWKKGGTNGLNYWLIIIMSCVFACGILKCELLPCIIGIAIAQPTIIWMEYVKAKDAFDEL